MTLSDVLKSISITLALDCATYFLSFKQLLLNFISIASSGANVIEKIEVP